MSISDELRSSIRGTGLPMSQIARLASVPITTLYSFMSGQSNSLRADTYEKVQSTLAGLSSRGVGEEAARFVRGGVQIMSDQQLKAEADSLGVDTESVARQAIEDAIKRKRIDTWIDENRDAFAANARDVEENGLWSDGLRQF